MNSNALHHTCSDSRWSAGVARGIALFVGVFAGLSLLGKLRAPAFDPNLWWIDLRVLPAWLADGLVALFAALLLAWSGWKRSGPRLRLPLLAVLVVFIAATLANAGVFWWLLAQGRIQTSMPVPLSLVFGFALGFVAWHVGRDARPPHRSVELVACAFCFAVFPVLQCVGFGKTERIKLACERKGLDVRTVPARPAHWARLWPLASMAREVPAFWVYYVRALIA